MEGARASVEMTQGQFPAAFMRGGTSEAIMYERVVSRAARRLFDGYVCV